MEKHIPIFYQAEVAAPGQITWLEETTGKHVGMVLRKQAGDIIQLTNGQGQYATAQIVSVHKSKVAVQVVPWQMAEKPTNRQVAIAIAPTKNTSRLEWFLEKATELGVHSFYLLQTDRTEKSHLRYDRLTGIIVSAMLQSQQCYLPTLHPMSTIEQVLAKANFTHKYIAHCEEGNAKQSLMVAIHEQPNSLIFIGPEGDFTSDEIVTCLHAGCKPVSLGETRLRTETAAMVAATIGCLAP